MAQTTTTRHPVTEHERPTRFTPIAILLALLPLVLLGGVLALIIATDAGLG